MRDNGKALRSTVEAAYGASASMSTNGREPVAAGARADTAEARPPHA
jgi:hypothetical protein